MRLVNGTGGVMYAAGDVAEFYLGRGWRDAGAAPVADGGEPVKAAPKRTTRRRKADNGVDATK